MRFNPWGACVRGDRQIPAGQGVWIRNVAIRTESLAEGGVELLVGGFANLQLAVRDRLEEREIARCIFCGCRFTGEKVSRWPGALYILAART